MKFLADSSSVKNHHRTVQPDIKKADFKTRRRAILWMIVIVVLGGVALYFANDYWVRLETELQAGPTPERLEQILARFKLMFGIVYGVMWLAVANLIYQSLSILRAGQFPLPNTKVVRDTPILQGKAARTRAFILIGLAAVLVILLIVVAVMGVRLLEYFQKMT